MFYLWPLFFIVKGLFCILDVLLKIKRVIHALFYCCKAEGLDLLPFYFAFFIKTFVYL